MHLEYSVTCGNYLVFVMIEFKRLRSFGYEVRTRRHCCRLLQGKGNKYIFIQTLRGTSKLLTEMFLEDDDLFHRDLWWKIYIKMDFKKYSAQSIRRSELFEYQIHESLH